MQPITTNFSLRKGVFLVKGAKRAALYDTNSKDIFSIDEIAKAGLEAILNGNSTQEASKQSSLSQENLENYLRLLQNNKLIIEGTDNQLAENTDLYHNHNPPRLEFVWLELTKGCNLRCMHCYNESDLKIFDNGKIILKHDEWKEIISQLADIGVGWIQFIGGEPFLYKTILDLAEFTKKRGIKEVEIFTNGTHLDIEKVKRINELGLRVAVSLYGASAKVHDSITGKQGSFEQTVKGIHLLKDSSVPLRISTIAMRDNEECLDETLNYIQNYLKVEDKGYDIVRPVGRGLNQDLVPKSLYEKSLIRAAAFQGINLKTFLQRSHHHPCFYNKLYIDVYGEIFPCVMEREESLGSTKTQTVAEILAGDSSTKYRNLTKDQIDSCRNCEYRLACFDCRPKAKKANNYLAKPKECLYNPYTGIWGEQTEELSHFSSCNLIEKYLP